MEKNNRNIQTRMTGWTQLFDESGVAQEKYRSFLAFFDENENKIEELHYNEDGIIIIKKQFNHKGKVLEEVYFNYDGSFNFKYIYTYDQEGREIEKAMYLKNDRLHDKCLHEYDKKGRIIESVWYDKEGNVEVKDEYEYDEKENVVTKLRGTVAEWTNTYDKNGKLVSITGGYFSDDEISQIHFLYDEDCRLVQKNELDYELKVKSITTYEYSGEK